MDSGAVLDMNKICRTCLTKSENMISIYSELCSVQSDTEHCPAIAEILSTLFSVKLQADDGLPSRICMACIVMAQTSYRFQKQCSRSQTILHSYLEQKSRTAEKLNVFVKNNPKSNEHDEMNDTDQDESQPDFCLVEESVIVPDDLIENETENSQSVEIKRESDPLKINSSNQPKKEKSYTCAVCDKSYKHGNSLRVHMRDHTEERPYTCKTCGKSFKQCSSLLCHKRSHTGEQPYVCKLCGKRYKQSGTLTAHMRVHTGQRPFLCSICGRGFRQAPDLSYHMRSHTKEKPYMCNVCGKTMSMQSHLVQHMRSHTGERPYKCDICDKAFPSSARLKRHAIIHTSLKPYSCEVCSRSFNRLSSLKVHSKIHTDERAHLCPICNKGFIQAHALKSHLMSHSSEIVSIYCR